MSDAISGGANLSSGSGMQTSIWGATMWFFLHTMAANYPNSPTDEQKHAHVAFLTSLGAVLPCRFCRDNFKSNMSSALSLTHQYGSLTSNLAGGEAVALGIDHPALASRENFFELIWMLHGEVSRAIGDGYTRPGFTETRIKYEAFRSQCDTKKEQIQLVGESGCTEPVHGQLKGRCTIRVVNHGEDTHVIRDDRAACPPDG